MSEVDLAAVSGSELRRLLGSARERGDAALAYEILKEMAARREPQPGGSRRRPRGEPRIVTLDLGDPADREDEIPPAPAWRPPIDGVEAAGDSAEPPAQPELVAEAPGRRSRRAASQPAPEPVQAVLTPLPAEEFGPMTPPAPERRVHAAPEPDLRFRPLENRPAPRQRRPKRMAAVVVSAAVGAAGGVGVGWFLGGMDREPASASAAPGAAHAMTLTTAQQPAPAPPTGGLDASLASIPSPPPAAQADAALQTEGAPASTPPTEADLSAPEPPQPPAAAPDNDGTRTTPAAQVAPAQTTAAGKSACTSEPTPADRTICGDPRLQRLQRELRLAYAEALEAHKDKALLRERQLAWREARNSIDDRERLALAYAQRIEKLKAATADAQKLR